MHDAHLTADDRRDQTAVGGCGTDPTAWLARLHSRTLDKIPDASARRMLQRCWLMPTDASGWPSWLLRSADGLRLPPDVRSAYRKSLEVALQEACAALLVTEPPPQDARMHMAWVDALDALELPSTRMLLSQQARLTALTDLTATVEVQPEWMAMLQSRLSLLEAAFARALGTPRAVVLQTGEVR